MSIQFYPQLPFVMRVGDTCTLDQVEWICLVSCTVIGYTIERSLPVLGSPLMPHLNSVELAVKDENPNVKPGQSLTEARSLGNYQQVGPNDIEEIEGKKILKWTYDSFDNFLMVFEDGTYLKMELDTGANYESPHLRMEEITLGDLHLLKLIPEETWAEHLAEKKKQRAVQNEIHGAHQLAEAIDNLGIERVKEMVAKTAPEI